MNVIDYILVEKLKVNSKTKVDNKDEIKYKIPTGKIAKQLFDTCMLAENDSNIYEKYYEPFIQKILKINHNSLQLSRLLDSNELNTLVIKCSIKSGYKPSTNSKTGKYNLQLLKKYLLACVFKDLTGYDYELNQECEDFMHEWDYYNGPNKLEWN